ncbi:sulfite exporter TauE/SafE family protein [uncultured Vibrio sp.]|uniref:sulfite exporter TauE/SafE family protein n=1 Tax=uncultured Vibrio sp. TaxID=114054 RepID=UPI0025D4307C|nr:sulfite exporter TauE/SafE family protein [uncultured Vibrio sp.]
MGLEVLLIVIAGVIRGYTGFGFSVIAAMCLSFVYPPIEAVFLAITLDLLSSLTLLRNANKHSSRGLVYPLVFGMVLSLPLGLVFVTSVSPEGIQYFIAFLSFVAGALILMNFKLHWLNERFAFGAGAVSGFCMTTASAGGPPLILYLMNLSVKQDELRSTSILFFFASSLLSFFGLYYIQSIELGVLFQGVALFPAALLGNVIGGWAFKRWPVESPTRVVAPILMSLSVLVFIS